MITILKNSVNLEMSLQKIRKSALPAFDEKRCYSIEIESLPWVWSITNKRLEQ